MAAVNLSSSKNLILEQIAIGPMQNYAYTVGSGRSGEVFLVDPGWEADTLTGLIESKKRKAVGILLTHAHYDHVNAVPALLRQWACPVYIHELDAPALTFKVDGLRTVRSGEKILLEDLTVECLHTPGHTRGSQCFYVPGHLMTGDTLFIDACGRCDLPGGSQKDLSRSLHGTIGSLPDQTVICPGHDYGPKNTDTLEGQKRTNPFMAE